jgi:copper chaperone CopZ
MEETPVRKAVFFGFAMVLGLILVGFQADVMACGASSSGAAKMGKTGDVKATMAGTYSTEKEKGVEKAKMTMKKAEGAMEDANLAKFATAEFSVKGMTCGGCENQVKSTLMNIDGVDDVAKVCHVSEHAVIKYDPAKVKPTDLASAISKLGYKSEYKMASADEVKDKAMDAAKEMKTTEM